MPKFRKYFFKEDYFDKWSRNMAYILGFITADGNVKRNRLSIGLNAKDLCVLNFIKSELQASIPLYFRESNNSYMLAIHSKKMIKRLLDFGITERKSLSIEIAFDIPKEYLYYYILGVFDGDGCVVRRRNTLLLEIYSGSYNFIKKIKELTSLGNIQVKERKRINKLYCLRLGQRQSVQLRDLMYADNGFCLLRKKEKCYNFYHPVKRRWTKEETLYLIENYNRLSIRDIQLYLKRTVSSIQRKLLRLKLCPQNSNWLENKINLASDVDLGKDVYK
jgi:hypothetical protein